MFQTYNLKRWMSWRLVSAQACSAAVAVSFNATWRVPRDAFRYGALPYLLVYTVAMATVGLPLTLMHLAIGQLSQQDVVGAWRAVPFFKGIGYVKLLVSLLSSLYTVAYVALTVSFFFYTFTEALEEDSRCLQPRELRNSSDKCLNGSYLLTVNEDPEFYVSVGVLVITFWMLFPFLLYNPTKFMKRSFYSLAPIVLTLCIVVGSCISESSALTIFTQSEDWLNYLQPYLWHAAFTQALISSQISGGFLISAGDSIYSYNDVLWSAFVLAGTNLAASYGFVVFWFGTSDSGKAKDTGLLAVLAQTYDAAAHRGLSAVWPAAIAAMLFFSGIITTLTVLYPLYERFRRLRPTRWRSLAALSSALSAALSAGALAAAPETAALLDEQAVPLLVHLATALEVAVFVSIYGWKTLLEDTEFLRGRKLWRCWRLSWCAAPGILLPLTAWWAIAVVMSDDWAAWPLRSITLLAAGALAILVVAVFAGCAVVHQCQFDFVSKLKASFTPSRHWGPRDPITHYYWMSRREELQRGDAPRADSARWQLGQLSTRSTVWKDTSDTRILPQEVKATGKLRSNSDDFFWTVCRRNEFRKLHENKRRSRSLDWRHIFTYSKSTKNTLVLSAFDIYSTKQAQREDIEKAINAKADSRAEFTVQE